MNDEQLVTLYLDGELDQEVALEFEERLADDPELLSLLEEQLKLSTFLTASSQYESESFHLEGFTERVMEALPKESPFSSQQQVESQSSQVSQGGIFAWFADRMPSLFIGAAVAAAILISLRAIESPTSPNQSTQVQGRSTVLINLDEAKSEGAAPVIWVLDDEETAEGGAEGGDDDPI